MPMVRGLRTLNLVQSGNITGTCLETILTGDAGRYSDFTSIFSTMPGTITAVMTSNTAMCSISNSYAAMCSIWQYPLNTSFNYCTSICNILNSSCALTFLGQNNIFANNAVCTMLNSPCACRMITDCAYQPNYLGSIVQNAKSCVKIDAEL